MSIALKILEKLKEEKLDDYWSTMKEYRMPLSNELNQIDEAIKEVKDYMKLDEEYYN